MISCHHPYINYRPTGMVLFRDRPAGGVVNQPPPPDHVPPLTYHVPPPEIAGLIN